MNLFIFIITFIQKWSLIRHQDSHSFTHLQITHQQHYYFQTLKDRLNKAKQNINSVFVLKNAVFPMLLLKSKMEWLDLATTFNQMLLAPNRFSALLAAIALVEDVTLCKNSL